MNILVIGLIVHGLLAVLLLGALTHQTIGLFFRAKGSRTTFVAAVRKVSAGTYPNAVVLLYVLTFTLGALLYPDFRVDVRTIWDSQWPVGTGSFEIKEHYGAIGLGTLPAYWATWRENTPQVSFARGAFTLLLTFIVWSDFLLGHVLNNVAGLS